MKIRSAALGPMHDAKLSSVLQLQSWVKVLLGIPVGRKVQRLSSAAPNEAQLIVTIELQSAHGMWFYQHVWLCMLDG